MLPDVYFGSIQVHLGENYNARPVNRSITITITDASV
jgi:hypothetical protein